MTNYKPKDNDIVMQLIASTGKTDVMKHMKKNPDGSYPVKLTFGGVELDFTKIADKTNDYFNRIITAAIEIIILQPIKDAIPDIEFAFAGIDNDALTWDFTMNTFPKTVNFIKYRDEYGYYLSVNKDCGPEILSITEKDKDTFVEKVVCTLNAMIAVSTL